MWPKTKIFKMTTGSKAGLNRNAESASYLQLTIVWVNFRSWFTLRHKYACPKWMQLNWIGPTLDRLLGVTKFSDQSIFVHEFVQNNHFLKLKFKLNYFENFLAFLGLSRCKPIFKPKPNSYSLCIVSFVSSEKPIYAVLTAHIMIKRIMFHILKSIFSTFLKAMISWTAFSPFKQIADSMLNTFKCQNLAIWYFKNPINSKMLKMPYKKSWNF